MDTRQQPIGIIGAMTVEIEAILERAEIARVERYSSMDFHIGTLEGVPIVAAVCGPGKVNAALCAQVMMDRCAPRAVLNIGVAGGLGPVKIGEVVIADHCVQHDFSTLGLGGDPGAINLPPDGRSVTNFPCDPAISDTLAREAEHLYGKVHRGPIATGDVFVADAALSRALYEEYGALACEMEGASIAHACLLGGVPCAVLRSISDNANDDASVDFPAFARESAQKAQRLLASVIGRLARL